MARALSDSLLAALRPGRPLTFDATRLTSIAALGDKATSCEALFTFIREATEVAAFLRTRNCDPAADRVIEMVLGWIAQLEARNLAEHHAETLATEARRKLRTVEPTVEPTVERAPSGRSVDSRALAMRVDALIEQGVPALIEALLGAGSPAKMPGGKCIVLRRLAARGWSLDTLCRAVPAKAAALVDLFAPALTKAEQRRLVTVLAPEPALAAALGGLLFQAAINGQVAPLVADALALGVSKQTLSECCEHPAVLRALG